MDALVERARERALEAEPRWRALLHFERTGLRPWAESDLEAPGFFLSPDGPRDAEAELEATIRALWSEEPAGGPDAQAQCTHPARLLYLSETLDLDPGDWPRRACPAFDAWRAQLGDVQPTLIFPEAFMGNPASMFGHTLVRFDPPGARERSRLTGETLLGWTLDFTADSRGDQGLPYLVRGSFGAYRGRYGLAPYYQKVRVYGDFQNRDIWEYPLETTDAEREILLAHLWELREAEFPYLFFSRNCSEKIVRWLRVAWPDVGLGGGFPGPVIPVDTLRAVVEREPTAPTPLYRPSPESVLRHRMAGEPAGFRRRVRDLAEGRLAPDAPELEAEPPERRARALELAYDWLRYRYLAGQVDDASSRSLSRALLVARSRTGVPPEATRDAPVPTPAVPPHEGHGTAMVGMAGGLQDREPFVEWRLRPAFHALSDRVGGYTEGAEIRVLDTRLRWFPALDRVRLHELVALDVTSVSPWSPPFRPLAWRFDAGLRTQLFSDSHRDGLDPEPVFRAQGGAGVAVSPFARALAYALAEGVVEAGPAIEGDASLGPGLRLGASWRTPADLYAIHVYGRAVAFAGIEPSFYGVAGVEQRIALARQHALVLDARLEHAYENSWLDLSLAWRWYF